MNPHTGKVYIGVEEISAAQQRGEPLIFPGQRLVQPAGNNHDAIVQQLEQLERLSETRQVLSVGRRRKLKL